MRRGSRLPQSSSVPGCQPGLFSSSQGEDLSQGEAEAVLCAGLHTATDDEEGQAALAALQKATLKRLLAILGPLEHFWAELPIPAQCDSQSLKAALPMTGPMLLGREALEASLYSCLGTSAALKVHCQLFFWGGSPGSKIPSMAGSAICSTFNLTSRAWPWPHCCAALLTLLQLVLGSSRLQADSEETGELGVAIM